MEIKNGTSLMLKVLYVIAWILFIGLCIEAGGILFNVIFSMFINEEGAQNFWQEIDLSNLRNFNKSYFFTLGILISIASVLKALIFYLIIKILKSKKLNLMLPFNSSVKRFISNISYLALGIGLFSQCGAKYSQSMANLGVNLPDIQDLRIGGADVWFFMGITLFVIAQLFKRGIEIQNENELTV